MDIPSIIISVLVLGVVIYFLIGKPSFFSGKSTMGNEAKFHTIEDKYNAKRREKEIELDSLLDKIARNGVDSLSPKEKERLDQLSTKK